MVTYATNKLWHAANVQILVDPLSEEFHVIVFGVNDEAFPGHDPSIITEQLAGEIRESLAHMGFLVDEPA